MNPNENLVTLNEYLSKTYSTANVIQPYSAVEESKDSSVNVSMGFIYPFGLNSAWQAVNHLIDWKS